MVQLYQVEALSRHVGQPVLQPGHVKEFHGDDLPDQCFSLFHRDDLLQRSKGVQHLGEPGEKLGQVLGALVLHPHDEAAFPEDKIAEAWILLVLVVPDLLQPVGGLQSLIALMAAPGAPLPGPPLRYGGGADSGVMLISRWGMLAREPPESKTRLDSHCW